MRIASYWASMGVRVDKKSVAAVDTTLTRLEKKLRNFGKLTNKHLKINLDVNVDQQKLNASLGHSLDLASRVVRFEITRFIINDAALMAALIRAMHNLPPLPPGPRPRPPRPNPPGPNPPGPNPRRDLIPAGVAAGGIGGIAARGYAPAIALAGGAYGLGALNKRNQEVVAAQMQTQAVVQQFGGTKEQGSESFEWLKGQADRIGFNYLDATGDYNRLVSGLMGTGGTLEGSQDVFKGFSEFGRTNKLGAVQMKRIYKALGDVAGKNQLQAEELTNQFGDSLPGATAMFAQAYQDKLLAEGKISTRMSEQDAVTKLRADMKKGLVKGDILSYAGKRASTMAQPGLEAAASASQAEQARFQNEVNNQAVLASNAGVESGFARIFRTLAAVMKESTPVVEGLARAFDELSKYASFAMLLPQSFKRAFEGRDSWVADALGEQNTATAKALYEGMKELGVEITKTLGIAVDGWKLIFDEFGDELLLFVNGIKNFFLYTFKAINSMLSGDLTGANNASNALRATLAGSSQEDINKIANGEGKAPTLLETAQGAGKTWLEYTPPGIAAGVVKDAYSWVGEKAGLTKLWGDMNNPSIQYNPLGMFPEQEKSRAAAFDQTRPLTTPQSTQNTVAVTMDVKISAANPEDFNEQFQEKFKGVIQSTLQQYGQKE
jgi:hypothetical protein